jgi:hypothetical protein
MRCTVSILLLQSLADTQSLYETLPPFNDLLLLLGPSLLLSLFLSGPIRLAERNMSLAYELTPTCELLTMLIIREHTSSTASSFSAATTIPVMRGNARRLLNSNPVYTGAMVSEFELSTGKRNGANIPPPLRNRNQAAALSSLRPYLDKCSISDIHKANVCVILTRNIRSTSRKHRRHIQINVAEVVLGNFTLGFAS